MKIRTIPPTISAARNCQPRKIRMRMPNSMTRLVEANIKATAATKWAPFTISALAVAKAAKEQDELIAPNNVARLTLFVPALPKYGVSFPLGTNAWIMALIKYPSTKAHPDFQKKPAAVLAASP